MDDKSLLWQKEQEILILKEENLKLQDTISWMHDMIWDLIKKQRKSVSEAS